MESFCEEIVTDKYGNLFCKRTNNKNLKNVVLDAHTDTVGLIVKEICENGFLKFAPLGGIDARVLPAAEVIVHGEKDILFLDEPFKGLDEETKDKVITYLLKNTENTTVIMVTHQIEEAHSLGAEIIYLKNGTAEK